MKELIRKLTESFGPSGYESAVRELITSELPRGVETRVDPMGSLIVHKKGTGGGKRVMLAAHMDEIGVCITHVDQKGFLRFGSVGGVRLLPLLGGRVRFADGTIGVIGVEKLDDGSRIPPLWRGSTSTSARPARPTVPWPSATSPVSNALRRTRRARRREGHGRQIGCAVLLQTLRTSARLPTSCTSCSPSRRRWACGGP